MAKYTVAMATYDDYDGVFFTIQALRMYHDMVDCEIVVLDNNPNGPHSTDLRNFIVNIGGYATEGGMNDKVEEYLKRANASKAIPVRYHTISHGTGTSTTRHELFNLAQGELVIVMDCHILLQIGAIKKMKSFWEQASPEMQKNMFTGPLLMDGLSFHQTHFECEWRSEMWGTWATAWRKGDDYAVVERTDLNTSIKLRRLMGTEILTEYEHTWEGHDVFLRTQGWNLAGVPGDDAIFEVPAQGLGLFAAAKEHWLGFNPYHRHFGGEECYIHEKYRQAGRKTYCLPWMSWNHRFGRPGGPKYPITREGKMRNYVLEFQELGLDVEPIRKHFIDEVKLPKEAWEKCIADPINFDPYFGWAPNTAPNNMTVQKQSNMGFHLPSQSEDLTAMALDVASKPRDLHPHFPDFMRYTQGCTSVLEVSKRRETTLWLAAGIANKGCGGKCDKQQCTKEECKRTLVSFQMERDTLLDVLKDACVVNGIDYIDNPIKTYDDPIEVSSEQKFDVMYIHHQHNYERLRDQLNALGPSVRKRILLTGTAGNANGLTGEDGKKPGLLHAIRGFCFANPQWFVAMHNNAAYGLTVLSTVEDDRPSDPITPWPMTDDAGNACGVGQEIKKILKSLGIESTPDCSCNRYALQLDADGPEVCLTNIEAIVDWLEEQAKQRKLEKFFVRPAVKLTVKYAIYKARKAMRKGLCG